MTHTQIYGGYMVARVYGPYVPAPTMTLRHCNVDLLNDLDLHNDLDLDFQ